MTKYAKNLGGGMVAWVPLATPVLSCVGFKSFFLLLTVNDQ